MWPMSLLGLILYYRDTWYLQQRIMCEGYAQPVFATASESILTLKMVFEVTSDSITQYLEVIAVFQ